MYLAREINKALLEQAIRDVPRIPPGKLNMALIGMPDSELAVIMQQNHEVRPHDAVRFMVSAAVENRILDHLAAAGLLARRGPIEIWAQGLPIVGHLDGVLHDGSIVEVRRIDAEDFERVQSERKLPRRFFDKVQMLMGCGGYERTQMILSNRESGKIWVKHIHFHEAHFEFLMEKAQGVLALARQNFSQHPCPT